MANDENKKDKRKARRKRRRKVAIAAKAATETSNARDAESDSTDANRLARKARRKRRRGKWKERRATAATKKALTGSTDASDEKKTKRAKKRNRARNRKKAKIAPAVAESQIGDFPMQRLSSDDDVRAAFPSIGALGLPLRPKGRFVVNCDGVPFHAYFQRTQHKRLFVLLDGAVGEDRSIPQFERRSWAGLMPGSILCVSDPTLELSDQLSMGWYIGTQNKDYTAQMAQLVEKVATELGLSRSDVVFYASSGGGFASLMCARLLPGSKCILVNPHIDVLKHNEWMEEQFTKIFSKATPISSASPRNTANAFRC